MRAFTILAFTLVASLGTSANAEQSLSKKADNGSAKQSFHRHVQGRPCTECTSAHRAEQIARVRYLLYFRSGHRLEMSRLDSEIRVVQAQLTSSKKLTANYRRLNGYWTKNGRPFPVTEERSHLATIELQERLKLLRKERLYALQNHQLQVRLRLLEIEQLVAALQNPIAVTIL
jgi:hypothetical protein